MKSNVNWFPLMAFPLNAARCPPTGDNYTRQKKDYLILKRQSNIEQYDI